MSVPAGPELASSTYVKVARVRTIPALGSVGFHRKTWLVSTTVAALVFSLEPVSWASRSAAPGDNSSTSGAPQGTHGASFDCTKASTRVEKMICSDDKAADLDGRLARAYRAALASAENAASLKAEQRGWLTTQRNKCADVTCLRQSYEKRLAALAALGGPIAEHPQASPERAAGSPPAQHAKTETPGVRTVKFPGGQVTLESDGDFEKVTIRGPGDLLEESVCNAGYFDQYSAFFSTLKSAVVQNDRAAVVNLMAFPLRVNGSKATRARTFRNKAALLSAFDEVFTVNLREAFRRAEPTDIFCEGDGQTQLGSGLAWADFSSGKGIKVAVINGE